MENHRRIAASIPGFDFKGIPMFFDVSNWTSSSNIAPFEKITALQSLLGCFTVDGHHSTKKYLIGDGLC